MAKLSKVDAAKAAGVSRKTLYTYTKDGRLSVDADGLIDTAELLRAGFALHTGHAIGRQDVMSTGHELTSRLDTGGQNLTSNVDTLDVSLDMIALLKQQLSEAQAREQAALARETVARNREDLLLHMLQDMQHRYDRLLEAPRTSVPPQTAQEAPGTRQTPEPPGRGGQRQDMPQPQPPTQTRDPRGDMRRRIVALLQAHPEGLSTSPFNMCPY